MNRALVLAAALFKRFALDRKAVAVIEFALLVPILLVLYLGSVDVSQGISADRKLASVAGTLGDLVAQTRDSLPMSVLEDYFSASEAIMLPFDGSDTEMLLTIVRVDADGNAFVRASQGRNGATGLAVDTPYALPEEITNLATDGYLVISEAWYDYKPLFSVIMTEDVRLYKQFFYVPRFGEEIRIVPG